MMQEVVTRRVGALLTRRVSEGTAMHALHELFVKTLQGAQICFISSTSRRSKVQREQLQSCAGIGVLQARIYIL